MVWVKLSDGAPLERRRRSLSPTANWMLQCLLAYSNRELTDGSVSRDELESVQPGRPAKERAGALRELEAAGAVAATDDGWLIVWDLELQPTAEEALDQKAKARERQRRKRARNPEMSRRDTTRDVLSDAPSDDTRESRRESRIPVPSRPVPSRSEEESTRSAERSVFDHWVAVMGKAGAKFTRDRVTKIRARIADGYTAAQLCTAIDGCKRSSFHMGENDRGKPYNDLTTILKNGAAVEAHIETAGAPRVNGKPVASMQDRVASEVVLDA